MSGMGQMDPAWLAYYQSMGLYNMAQSSGAGAASSANKPTDGAANASGPHTAASGLHHHSSDLIRLIDFFSSDRCCGRSNRLQSAMD